MAAVLSLASTYALTVPPSQLHAAAAGRRAPPPTMQQQWHWDSIQGSIFLNEPIEFIQRNPQHFSADLQALAAYHYEVNTAEFSLWGGLPAALGQSEERSASLREKSMRANELAQIVVKADRGTLRDLAGDATFQEKKAFFEALAALPEGDNGMIAIDGVITRAKTWGHTSQRLPFSCRCRCVCWCCETAGSFPLLGRHARTGPATTDGKL